MSDFELDGPHDEEDGGVRFGVGVPKDLKYFEGHFAGDPVVPGVAQLALVESAARRTYPDLGTPVGMKRIKFSAKVLPEDRLALSLSRAGAGSEESGGPVQVRFRLRSGETLVSQGTLIFLAGS